MYLTEFSYFRATFNLVYCTSPDKLELKFPSLLGTVSFTDNECKNILQNFHSIYCFPLKKKDIYFLCFRRQTLIGGPEEAAMTHDKF